MLLPKVLRTVLPTVLPYSALPLARLTVLHWALHSEVQSERLTVLPLALYSAATLQE